MDSFDHDVGRTNKGGQHEIYMTALRDRFMTLDKAREIAGREKNASMALWRLNKQQNLVHVRGGLYAAIPPERTLADYEINRFALADRLIKGSGAIAFHSALELHGAAYSSFSMVFYLSARQVRPLKFHDITYRSVLTSDSFGTTTVRIDDVLVRVTDKERTFLDCIRRPDLCGGVEEYLKSLDAFVMMDPEKILQYLSRFNEKSLYHRAGVVLSLLKDSINVPDRLLDEVRSEVGPSPCYLVPNMRRGGRLVKEWNVFVPRNLTEMMRVV